MLFKEYDKKMRSFRPDLQYWEDILTKEKEWEKVNANKALVYTTDQIKEFQATDRIARSVYVVGNGGTTDVYTNQDTAYEIREALRARYKNTEQWGLTTLTEKFNKEIRANQYACPDIWFDSLQYYKELMVKAGGSAKTDAEVVVHILVTAPNSYDSITTLVL
jgi:predicted Zn-dependent protease